MQLGHLVLMISLATIAQSAVAATTKVPPHEPAKSTLTDIDSVKSLGWLEGNWLAKGPKGTVQLSGKSVGSGEYLYMTFVDDKGAVSELQVIGWSPKARTVFSWSFDGSGGFGKSLWKKDRNSNDWHIKSIAANRSGSSGHAKYLLHKIDDNNFTWKSIGRSVDGKRMPDTSEVTVTRQ